MSDEFDENRELCSDGNCLGVIVDGKCNVCGSAAADGPRDGGTGQATDTSSDSSGPRDPGSGGALLASADDFESRQLCPDGACTGLIGPDGKCKVCGRTSSGPSTS
jgi:hypothetical protein